MKIKNLKVILWLLWFCILLQLQIANGQNLTRAEYYFDSDPGGGMGTPIPSFVIDTAVNYTFTANVSGLSVGYHTLYVRVKDSSSQWSIVAPQLFYVNSFASFPVVISNTLHLSKAEYFIDSDPGQGNGISMFVFSSDSVNQAYTINTSALSAGTHIIGVRVMNVGGIWSVINSKQFNVINTACSPPHALFTYDTVNSGNTTHFTNLSTNVNVGTTYLWKIIRPADTITATTNNFQFAFSNPGLYDVILKVSNSDTCTSFWQQKIIVGPLLSQNITVTGNTVLCNGDSVSLQAPDGSNYLWSNGATTKTIIVKTSGVYQVSYTNLYNNNIASNQVKIIVNPTLDFIVTVSSSNNSMANGSAFATPSGGSNIYYQYSWSTGQTTPMVSGLVPGYYSLTITDGVCPVTKSYFMPNSTATPHGIIAAEYNIDDLSQPAQSLIISFDDTISSFCNIPMIGVSPGYHQLYVRVKDSSGLWSSMSGIQFFINQIDTLDFPVAETIHQIVKCEYFFDNIDPGVGKATPLAGLISAEIINQNFNILLPDSLKQGFHFIAFRTYDERYGWSTVYNQLVYIKPLNDVFLSITDVRYKIVQAEYFIDSEPGIGNGIPLSIVPGDSLNMSFTADISSLTVGTHKILIRVKDLSNKWSVVNTFTFNIVAPIACTTPVPDFTFSNALAGQPVVFGNISSNVNSSTTYSWDIFNDNTIDFTTFSSAYIFPNAGVFPVKLTVSNGGNCISSVIHYITIGAILSNQLTASPSNEFCAGDSVVLSAPSGSNYQWNNGETTQSIVVKSSGNYQAVYADLNGILTSSNVIVVKVNPLMNVFLDINNSSNGLANGSASALVNGGSSWIYQYLFSNGETLQTASNLIAGNYFVQINDGKCPVIKNFAINNIIYTTSGIVYGEYYIDSIPDVGTPTTFSVPQGDTVGAYLHIPMNGLALGMHNVIVRVREITGLWSIPVEYMFFVNDTLPIINSNQNVNITSAEYFFDNNDPGPGNAIPIASLYPNTSINHNLIVPTTGLNGGFHTISFRVRDELNNWSDVLSQTIYIKTDVIYPQIDSTQYPLVLAEYYIDTDPGQGNGKQISITPGYSINESFSVDASTLSIGNHYVCVRVKDLKNKWSVVKGQLISVVAPNGCETPYADFSFPQANAGFSENFTNLSSHVNANSQYSWYITNNSIPDYTTFNASYIYPAPGIYGVTLNVSNGSNCQSTVIKQVNIGPIIPNIITVTGNLVLCSGDSVILTAPQGSNFYWPTSETSQSITVKNSGIYQVVYTDIYGYVRLSNAVNVIVNPLVNIVSTINPANNGFANGSAGLMVSGGNSFVYSYSWSTGDTLPSISGVFSGSYNVTVSDGVCPVNLPIIIPNNQNQISGIIGAEYFFDADPGVGMGASIPVNLGDTINSFVNASTTGLSVGLHSLYIRVKDMSGLWSIIANQYIYIYPSIVPSSTLDTLPYIVAAEYFYNTDPGIGNATPISIPIPSSSIDLTTNISTSGTNFGSNILAIRVLDSKNVWSVINAKSFMLCNPPSKPIVSADTTVCSGSSLTLRAGLISGVTYSWTGPNSYTSALQNPVLTNVQTSQSGYYKVYAVNNGNCYSKPDSINLTVNSIPLKPGLITSQTTACLNDTVLFYVPLLTGASSYIWNIPVPHTIIAGNNSNTIAVKFDTSMASIPVTVRGYSICGTSPVSDIYYISTNSLTPANAGTISGPSTVCQLQNDVVYSVPVINNAQTYVWSVPLGAFIVSGQGTRTIHINFQSNAISGNFSVFGRNSCGDGLASASFPVTVNFLPEVTQGSYANVCYNGNNITLTAGSPIGGVYSGQGVQNGVFNPSIAGTGPHTILYLYTSSTGCKDSATSVINVSLIVSDTGIISGPTTVCQRNTSITYSVSQIPNATSYIWTLPNGFTGQSSTNTITVNVDSLALSGFIKVKGSNYCGNGPEVSYYVNVNTAPEIAQLASPQTRCNNGPLSFIASKTTGSSIQWSIDNFLNIAAVGDTFIMPNLLQGTSVLVSYRAANLTTGCQSRVYTTTGTAYSIPQILSVIGDSVCDYGSVTLSAVTSAGTINWYSQYTGGTAIATGSPFTTQISTSTTYYVEAVNNSCVSNGRVAVNAVRKIVPSTPIVNVQNNCGNSILSTTANGTLLWNTGASTSSINVSNAGTYTVTQKVNGCISAPGSGIAAPILIINQSITINASSNPVNQGSSVTYTANVNNPSIGQTFNWYVNNVLQSSSTSNIYTYIPIVGDSIKCTALPIGCYTGGTSNQINQIVILPFPPSGGGQISGLNPVCKGQSGVIYTVTPIINATSYIWTLPNGYTGTSTSPSITINFSSNAVSDTIKVKGHNYLGDGPTVSYYIIVNTVPLVAGNIIGDSIVCQGQSNVLYTTSNITNATSYIWSFPTGASGSSTTSSVNANYSASAVSGNVTVKGHNVCGNGEASNKMITVNLLPFTPGVITGLTNVCQGQDTVTYSIPIIQNATYYTWTLPNGASGISYTNSIKVSFNNSASSGYISVKGHNLCGDGSSSYLYINLNQLSLTATDINGNTSLCIGASTTLNVTGGTLGTSANWKWYQDSCGGNLVGSGNSITINPTTTATYYVRAEGACNNTLCLGQIVNVSNNHVPGLDFTGNTGFVSHLVNPTDGTPTDLYRFEVKYTDVDGNLPSSTYPRLQLDFEGNGIYSNTNDRLFYMQEVNPNDTNVVDGKDYYYIAQQLPESQNWKTLINVTNQGGCSSKIGPLSEPKIVRAADISIFANDITFSNTNPIPGDHINVNAVIHNYSGRSANNFVVHLINQFDTTAVYPDITVQQLPAYSNTTVSWNIQTPANPAWCPMQVLIDWTNVLVEPNELDNQAIRPFKNGNYNLPGYIVITAHANPAVSISGSTIGVCGNAYYTGTAVHLLDSSCAGATVTYLVVETGQTGSTYTNSLGNYCFSFTGPITAGIYHVKAHITDYTLDGDTATTFEIVAPPPSQVCIGPDLVSSISLSSSITNCYGYCTTIRVGMSLTGTATVTNVGNAASPVTMLKIDLPDGTPVPGPFSIPALNPGQSYVVNLPAMTFNTVGGTYIATTADYNNQALECNEFNNSNSACIQVLPVLPDIVASGGMSPSYYQCQFNSISFRLDNVNGTPTGSFYTSLKVYKGATLLSTLYQVVNNINPLCWTYVTFNYTPSDTGYYTFAFAADIYNAVAESNELNNTVTVQTFFNICKPDLYVSGCGYFKVSPVNPTNPGTITIYANIVNGGLASATGPFTINFNVAGVNYPYNYAGVLAPYQSQQISITVPTPAFGNNLLIATADATNVIGESNELNNFNSASLCWEFSLSALCGNNMFWQHTQMRNQPVTLTVGAYNHGIYEASHMKVKFEVSGPGLVGWVDLGFTSTYAGTTCGCPFPVTLANPFAFPQVGTYQVRMTADYPNEYIECDETNNVLIVNVQVSDLPDYRVLSQYIAPSKLNPELNEPISIDLTYENIGTSTIDSLDLFARIDNTPFDTLRVRGLMTGTFNTVHLPNTWSSNVRGIHVIRSIIDFRNEISETDELDNEATRAFVVGKYPNLRFLVFNVSDTVPALGNPINIFATINNNGYAKCVSTYQLYYLDDNNNEVLIGQQPITVDSLASISLTVPWIVADTRTTIIGRIVNSNPVEYDLTDNEATKNIGGLLRLTTSMKPATCYSYANGVAKVIASGGQSPYNFYWNNGQSGDSIIAVAGTYNVIVTDANGVSATASVTITQPNAVPVSISIYASASVMCNSSLVTVTATAVNGGATPYYQWIKNGVVVGTDTNVYTFNAADNDSVKCILRSSIGCSTGNPAVSNLIVFSVNSLPVTAGTISGAVMVCQGQSNVVYTVPVIPYATSYIWTLPSGATGSSTSNTIAVNFGPNAVSGLIVVKGHSACGNGDSTTKAITVNPLPGAAGAITGITTLCQGPDTINYTTPLITNATNYVWTLPNGATGYSSTNSIKVVYSSSSVSGNITVKGYNNCGYGTASTLYITVNSKPATAGTITSHTNISQGIFSTTYSVPAIARATSYIWTLPDGSVRTTQTTSTSIICGSINVSGYLSVKGQNSCGDGLPSSIYLNVNLTKRLQIHTMIQGFYDGDSLMIPTVEYDAAADDITTKFNNLIVDTISVVVRSLVAPNYNVLAEYHNLMLYKDGTINDILLPSCITSYNYIVLNHRNAIETWSDSVNFTDTLIRYNFYKHAPSNQFLGNMLGIYNPNNAYVGSLMWSGDVFKDGTINIFDLSDVFDMLNNPNAPVGYVLEDINADGVVNIFDLSIVFDNINVGAGSVNPLTLKKK